MEIPQGNSREDNKARKQIIKEDLALLGLSAGLPEP